jgi:hypothetical protein
MAPVTQTARHRNLAFIGSQPEYNALHCVYSFDEFQAWRYHEKLIS